MNLPERIEDVEDLQKVLKDPILAWRRGKSFYVGAPKAQVLVHQTVSGTLYFENKVTGQLTRITEQLLSSIHAKLLAKAEAQNAG